MSGIHGRALDATSPGETQRHGILWTVKQWSRLAHHMMYVRCAAFFDTLSRELLMLIPTGRSEDIRLALRRREQRDEEQAEQCCEFSGGPLGSRQSLTERQPGNPVEEGAERLRSSPDRDPEGRQRRDVVRTTRDVLESVAAEGSRGDSEQSHNACVCREATCRDRTPLCRHGHGSMMMQATPQQSLYWECLTCSTTSGLSMDLCDVRLVERVSSEGVDANMVPIGEDETLCL